MPAGAFNVAVPAGATAIVALPPAGKTGVVKFGRVFLSLASFSDAMVELTIGKPNNFRTEHDVRVSKGRPITRDMKVGDEVASVVSKSGGPVAVLIEYEGL